MIQIGPRVRIYVGIDPIDFRKAYRGISSIVKNILKKEPLSGHVFIFRNKRGDAVKMICFDGHACWAFHVKFAQGRLNWWPSDEQIQAAQLMSLLSQGSSKVVTSSPFRDIA